MGIKVNVYGVKDERLWGNYERLWGIADSHGFLGFGIGSRGEETSPAAMPVNMNVYGEMGADGR